MNSSRRIILIDDEDVAIFGFSRVLKEPGMEVDCAQTAEDAKGLITTHQYNGAIVDLSLSSSIEMEGFDLVRLLRFCQVGCKIIVLTAFGYDSIRVEAKALGADFFFEKPMEPESLKTSLKSLGVYG